MGIWFRRDHWHRGWHTSAVLSLLSKHGDFPLQDATVPVSSSVGVTYAELVDHWRQVNVVDGDGITQ